MLSMTDFIGCSNLYECEVEAIAEHEHVPRLLNPSIRGPCIEQFQDVVRRFL